MASAADETAVKKVTVSTSQAPSTDLVAEIDKKVDAQSSKDYYFDSYSHFGIHEEMLTDEVRTQTYRSAICDNKHLFKDKVVLDIGCGTGILCLFAAQAGAKKVYGIECAAIAKHARKIVKKNGYEGVIEIIRGKVEEVTLPVEKVDIIVSEWMGYFMIFESMLDTVIFARDKWLAPGGIMMPDKGSIFFGGLEDGEYRKEKVDFWDSVYGFDMSCIKEDVLNEPLVDCVEHDHVVTLYRSALDVDLYTCTKEDLDFKSKVQLPIFRNDYMHALVAFFTVEFSKCHRNTGFTTGPHGKYTHWKQTVFYLSKELMVHKDTEVELDINVHRNAVNPRAIDINIKCDYKDQSQQRQYMMTA